MTNTAVADRASKGLSAHIVKAVTHVEIPKFNTKQLALAQICALELWNDFDYQNSKEFDVSDEDLIAMFSTPTFAIRKSARTRSIITGLDIRDLLPLAILKAFFRSEIPNYFQGAISAYRSTSLATYTCFKN